jgi:hypothetical protein
MRIRPTLPVAAFACLIIAGAAPAVAQPAPAALTAPACQALRASLPKPRSPLEVHRARRLGGRTAFVDTPLTDVASLQKWFDDPTSNVQQDLPAILCLSGYDAPLAGTLLSTILDRVHSGNVNDGKAFPKEGHIEWMALRRNKKPTILRNVFWIGPKSFPAFWIDIKEGDKHYVFIIPKDCGNLSLVTSVDEPRPACANLTVTPVCPGATDTDRRPTVTVSATAEHGEVSYVEARPQDGAAVTFKAPWTVGQRIPPGPLAFRAFDGSKIPMPVCSTTISIPDCAIEKTKEITVPAPSCSVQIISTETANGWDLMLSAPARPNVTFKLTKPGAAPVDVVNGAIEHVTATGVYVVEGRSTSGTSEALCRASVELKKPRVSPGGMFVGLFGGKERRVRDEFAGGRCAPMAGLKAGYVHHYGDNDVAVSLGAGFNTRDHDNSSLFSEIEYLRHISHGFVGTGFGVWDLTHSAMVTPSLLVNTGIALLSSRTTGQLYFAVEGRLFFDGIRSPSNNYQVWAGFRWSPSDSRE